MHNPQPGGPGVVFSGHPALERLPTTRLQGRPKSTWDDNVKQDICKMMIKNWTVCVQDRDKWRDVIEKANALRI